MVFEIYELTKFCEGVPPNKVDDRKVVPIIGEAEGFLTLILGFVINRNPWNVIAHAGTAKTQLVNLAFYALPKEYRDKWHRLGLGSPTAFYRQAPKLRDSMWIEFGEIQKFMQHEDAFETWKDFGEGRDGIRDVTDLTSQLVNSLEAAGLKVERMGDVTRVRIPFRPTIGTGALENESMRKLMDSDEITRRFPEIRTDPSVDLTRKVVKEQLRRAARKRSSGLLNDHDIESVQESIGLAIKFKSDRILGYVDPSAEWFAAYTPTKFTIARTYTQHMLSVVRGSAIWYGAQDERILHPEERWLFSAPADWFHAITIYGGQYIESVMKLPLLGRAIHSILAEAERENFGSKRTLSLNDNAEPQVKGLSPSQVAERLEEKGYSVDLKQVKSKLWLLWQSKYVITGSGTTDQKTAHFRASPHAIQFFDGVLDWRPMVDEARAVMEDEYPEVADEYIERFCTDPAVVHPITGETLKLFDITPQPIEDDDDADDAGKELKKWA